MAQLPTNVSTLDVWTKFLHADHHNELHRLHDLLDHYQGQSVGAPTTGAHIVGDWTSDPTNGCFWICTVAGTPGTFVTPSRNTELDRSTVTTQITVAAGNTSDTGNSVTFTVTSKPVVVKCRAKRCGHTLATNACIILLTDESNVQKDTDAFVPSANNGTGALRLEERFTTPGTYTRKVRCQALAGSGSAFLNILAASPTGIVLEAIEE